MRAGPPAPPSCSTCGVRKLCMSAGLSAADVGQLRWAITAQYGVSRHQPLFRAGERFTALFTVQAGSFELSVPQPEGARLVIGFSLAGDLIGLTGIAEGALTFDAIALEESRVCRIDFDRLSALARALPAIQHRLHWHLSREIAAQRAMAGLLAHAAADKRISAFLTQLVERRGVLGLPSDELVLTMKREDIGNLLGLRIETVSRGLSRLENEGILEVHGRRIRVHDRERLRRHA